MSSSKIKWIRSDKDLLKYTIKWKIKRYLFLDTEFLRVDTFYPLACLIQINDDECVYMIDPLMINDWQPLKLILEDINIIKVMHSCYEDLDVFHRLMNTYPISIFDTQIAAAYANIRFSIGYSSLIKLILNFNIEKNESRSNWLDRPLSTNQLKYAYEDVFYLSDLYKYFLSVLTSNKLEWILEDGANLVLNHQQSQKDDLKYKSICNAWKLNRMQLYCLKEICSWREKKAKLLNKPRGFIVSDECLFLIAYHQCMNTYTLSLISKISPQFIRRYGNEILKIMQNSIKINKSTFPKLIQKPLPKKSSDLLKKIREIVKFETNKLNISEDLLGVKKYLIEILYNVDNNGYYTSPSSFVSWRKKIVEEKILTFLNNE